MPRAHHWLRSILAILALPLFAAVPPPVPAPRLPPVHVMRVPERGLQPQIAVGRHGRVHLVYFTGAAEGGNLWYTVSRDGGRHFAPPLQVNRRPNDAVAVGNMRGAHLALAGGRVFVAWAGAGSPQHPPMWFTRLNAAGNAFLPERNLASPMFLDGGTVAAAGRTVEVYWHGLAPGAHSEAQRRVWMARSTDGGRSFASARPINNPSTGACGCCGMAAAAAGNAFYVIYRSARQLVHRDLFLLHSADGGLTFHGADFSRWNVGYCVMSTAQLTPTPRGGLLAAWEQRGHVLWAHVSRDGVVGPAFAAPIPNPGASHKATPNLVINQKYPVVAADRHGHLLLAWTEGMRWRRGGSLHWQIYSSAGQPLGPAGVAPGVPAWSLVAVWARPDGSFAVMY